MYIYVSYTCQGNIDLVALGWLPNAKEAIHHTAYFREGFVLVEEPFSQHFFFNFCAIFGLRIAKILIFLTEGKVMKNMTVRLPLNNVKVMAKRGSFGCFEIALMSTWNRTCLWNMAGAVLPLLYSTLNDIGELTLWDNSAICKRPVYLKLN